MSSPNSETAINYKHQGKVYPTLGFALLANRKALALMSQAIASATLLKPDALESALHVPVESAFNQDAYPRFFEKVAALTYRVIAGHAFADGNKRTGLILAEQTLNWNGYYLSASDETVSLVMLLIASGHLDVQGLRVALLYMCGLDPSVNPRL
jgi:death-on-curing protein